MKQGEDLHSRRWRVSSRSCGWKECRGRGNFRKLCARPPRPTEVCRTAGKTENFQRTPESMLRLHAGIGSQDVKRTMRVTSAVTFAAAGGFLPSPGEGTVDTGGRAADPFPGPGLQGCPWEKVFLRLAVEQSPSGAPFASTETMQRVSKTGRDCKVSTSSPGDGDFLCNKSPRRQHTQRQGPSVPASPSIYLAALPHSPSLICHVAAMASAGWETLRSKFTAQCVIRTL